MPLESSGNSERTLMETWHLELVQTVAKFKSFTQAATELCLTPTALSVQISKLEKELGVRLFVRTMRSVRLTPAGKELVKRAADILALTRETSGVMRQFAAQDSEHIAIGIEETPGFTGLPALIAAFERQNPDVFVSLVVSTDDGLLNLLESGEIDIAVFAAKPRIGGLDQAIELIEFCADENTAAVLAIPGRPYVSRAAQAFRRFVLKQGE